MFQGFMSRILLFVVLLVSTSWAFACGSQEALSPPEATADEGKPPTFSPGDKISVRVYGEEELGGEFQVQDDGSIDFPLVGSVAAAGVTQNELARDLELRLADGYLREPQVTVVVLQRANLEVSVLGAVHSPGRFSFVDNLTLVQAISTAGGLQPLAAPKRVKLTREGDNGPETVIVSVKDITEGRREDIRLRPGDIVFVPESPI
jgi:polysaccharide export outer membrane protein